MNTINGYRVLVLSFAMITMGACASGGGPATSIYQPSFDFQSSGDAAEESDVVLSLLAPDYASQEARNAVQQLSRQLLVPAAAIQGQVNYGARGRNALERILSDFQRAMETDFEEMLLSRGFVFKGPFPSYEEMVYADRRDSDLMLHPQIEIQPRVNAKPAEKSSVVGDILSIGGDSWVIESGTVALAGRVTLAVYEPMTRTRLWNRSISVPDTTIRWQGELEYDVPPYSMAQIMGEPQLQNNFARLMEDMYERTLQTASEYLDPEEMLVLREQAYEIREDAGFVIPQ